MSDAAMASALPLAVAIPIGGAVVAPLAGRVSGKAAFVAAITALAGSTGVLAWVAPTVFRGRILTHYLGNWGPTEGRSLGIAFAADPFGMVFALASAGIGLLLVLYALSELSDLGGHELGNFACLFLLLVAGLIGAALTADLFNLFVWFEVSALASYALTAFFLERPLALEAAFKMLVLTTLASFAIFLGSALVYGELGGLNLAQLQRTLSGAAPGAAALIALGLLVGGYATKAGLVPFHTWLPDAHTAAPGPVSALFSGLMVNLGIVAAGRLAFLVFDRSEVPVLGLLTLLGVVSGLIGAVMALFQDDLKRLLAFDTVSQMGVLALALGTGTSAGLAGASYHLANHALFKALLFLCAGAIVHTLGVERLSAMGGIARRKRAVAAAFVVGVAAIVGVPPLNGYFSLALIHEGVKEAHTSALLLVLGVVEVLTTAALARAGWLAFFRRRDEPYEGERPLARGMVAGLVGLGALCLAFGLAAGPVVSRVAAPAAASLLEHRVYAAAVLDGDGHLEVEKLHPHFWTFSELATVVVVLVVGLLLARAVVRSGREPRAVTALRALHNGSVNDYAAYAAGGLVAVVGLLGLS
ncbi:MAG TPA: complex I subunit 5 family protein [Acidimicrobiales bacterium]|nr:complex I subunit 5 family protein [Acidimicrobiales bacterium]